MARRRHDYQSKPDGTLFCHCCGELKADLVNTPECANGVLVEEQPTQPQAQGKRV